MRQAKEFRDQAVGELKALYRDLSKEIFHLSNEIRTTRKLEKPHLMRHKKKERARVLTVLNEKGETI